MKKQEKKEKTKPEKEQTKKHISEISIKVKLLIIAGCCGLWVLFVALVFKAPVSIIILTTVYVFLILFFAMLIPNQYTKQKRQKIDQEYGLTCKYIKVYLKKFDDRKKIDYARILMSDKKYAYYAKKSENCVRIKIINAENETIYLQDLSYTEFQNNFDPRWK